MAGRISLSTYLVIQEYLRVLPPLLQERNTVGRGNQRGIEFLESKSTGHANFAKTLLDRVHQLKPMELTYLDNNQSSREELHGRSNPTPAALHQSQCLTFAPNPIVSAACRHSMEASCLDL